MESGDVLGIAYVIINTDPLIPGSYETRTIVTLNDPEGVHDQKVIEGELVVS